MKPIQPLLILLLVVFGLVYVARFRSRLLNRLIVVFISGLGVLMVMLPDLSNAMAHFLGVGRGADLLTYLGLSGLAFLWLLMYSRLRTLDERMTVLARALAMNTARTPDSVEIKREDRSSPAADD